MYKTKSGLYTWGVILLVCVGATAVQAATIDWTGSANDGLYMTSSNWKTVGVPSTTNAYQLGTSAVPDPNVLIRGIADIGGPDTALGSINMGTSGITTDAILNIHSGGSLATATSGSGAYLRIGYYANNTGTVNLYGTATTPAITIGNSGTGEFNVYDGGFLNIISGGSFNIASSNDSNGTLTVNGNSDVNSAVRLYIGGSSGTGTGTVNMKGGRMKITGGGIYMAGTAGSTGTLDMVGGKLASAGIEIGYAGIGSFTSHGTADINMLNISAGLASIAFGRGSTTNSSANGTMYIYDNVKLVSSSFSIGVYGTGALDMEGGEIDLVPSGTSQRCEIVLGYFAGSSGTLNLDGGLIKISPTADKTGTGFAGLGSPVSPSNTAGYPAGTALVNVTRGVLKIKGNATSTSPGGDWAGCLSNFGPSFIPPWMTGWSGEGVVHVVYDADHDGYTKVWATHLDLADPADHIVNLADFAVVANDWGRTGSNLTGDIAGINGGPADGTVDYYDLAALASNWLSTI